MGRRLTLWLGQPQPAVSRSCLATRTTTLTSRAVGLTGGAAVIVATTLSSCQPTTPSLICVESDGCRQFQCAATAAQTVPKFLVQSWHSDS